MSGLDVFISYSREDQDAAHSFAERLAEEGFSVWWDAALQSGETFDEAIENALKAARSVLVLWSPRSVSSRWVRAEATLADRQKKLIPVIIEPCDRPIIFELTHTVDLSDWDGSTAHPAWRAVIKDVKRLVQRGEQPRPANGALPRERAIDAAVSRTAIPAQSSPARYGSRSQAAASPPRKVDNLVFSRVGGSSSQVASRLREAAVPTDDRTQFYTRSRPYMDQVHCLELTIGDRLEKRYVVSRSGLKIGRAAPADVILSDSRVSRAHCIVQLMDGELQVCDLGSTNGTYVDGERVSGSSILPVGSVLKVGNVSFRHAVRAEVEV